MPPPDTVPWPEPDLVTVTVLEEEPAVLNVAVTLFAASMVMAHEAVPLHAPDQPAKVEPGAGVAVRVTAVPAVREAVHVTPQFMLPPEIVPWPVPALDTVSV